MINIHKIERRGDLEITRQRINKYIEEREISTNYGTELFKKLIRDDFYHWKDNKGALTIEDYFVDIDLNIDIMSPYQCSYNDEQTLLYIQFILEMISHLVRRYKDLYIIRFQNWYDPLINMIKKRLELSNYQIHLEETSKTILITKRDVDVDSAIAIIDDNNVQLYLLEYLDFRTQNKLERKKEILFHLFKYWESHKQELKDTKVTHINNKTKQISPIDVFSEICNNYDVRHFPKELIKSSDAFISLSDEESNQVCDIAFYMFIEAIRISEIYKMRKYLAILNSKHNIEDNFINDRGK